MWEVLPWEGVGDSSVNWHFLSVLWNECKAWELSEVSVWEVLPWEGMGGSTVGCHLSSVTLIIEHGSSMVPCVTLWTLVSVPQY